MLCHLNLGIQMYNLSLEYNKAIKQVLKGNKIQRNLADQFARVTS